MTYDQSYIVEKFRGLIGFKPSFDIANQIAAIDEDLATSTSGQYVNSLHPLFTPENFASAVQQFSQFTVSTWAIGTPYAKDKLVKYSGLIYIALRDTTGDQPDTSSDDWKQTTILSVWYRNRYDAAVLEVMDKLKEEKKLEGHGKTLRQSTALLSNDGYSKDTETPSGRFVGFEITLKHPNLAVQLERVGLQLNADATVPIHIMYGDGDQEVEFAYASPYKRFKYIDITTPAFLSYEGSAIIGYEEADLGGAEAIYQGATVLDDDYCTSCGGVDSGSRSYWSEYVDIKPITIIDDELEYVTGTNFGLNLVLSFRCDLSDLLIRQKESLIPALKAQLKVFLLDDLAASIRSNGQADAMSNLAFSESRDWHDPDNPKNMLKRAIKALSFEFSGGYDKCLPCNGKVKIRTYSI